METALQICRRTIAEFTTSHRQRPKFLKVTLGLYWQLLKEEQSDSITQIDGVLLVITVPASKGGTRERSSSL